jgi:hypothetical protein
MRQRKLNGDRASMVRTMPTSDGTETMPNEVYGIQRWIVLNQDLPMGGPISGPCRGRRGRRHLWVALHGRKL